MRLPLHPLLVIALAFATTSLADPAATADGGRPLVDAEEHHETSVIMTVRPTKGLQVATISDLGKIDGVVVDGSLDQVGLTRLEVTDAGLAALDASGLIGSVLADHPMQLFLDVSTGAVEADAAQAAGFDGQGSLVAVIDSGVDPGQGAFGDRIVAEACFLSSVATPFDKPSELCPGGVTSSTDRGSAMPCAKPLVDCGHGTHVAGIAVSSLPGLEGVAPSAGLVAIRVMKSGGGPFTISTGDVLSALDHVLALARSGMKIAAVNLSLGGSPAICSDMDPGTVELRTEYDNVVRLLSSEGVAVVAASGNSADALVPVTDVAFPACLEGVIAVGATERNPNVGFVSGAGAEVTQFTQYDGAGLDLLAPGFDIESSVPGGTAEFDGTSMAAPHVAAAFALLAGSQSGWSPDRYAELLRSTGVMVERPTTAVGDRHLRFPELRLSDALGFTPFADAGSGFWVAASDWAKYRGVSVGVGDNRYDPDTTLNRAEAVTFLHRLMGEPQPSGSSGFTDVPDGTFFAAPVAWAAEAGITVGTGEGRFEPSASVTRAQMATFLWRLVGSPCCAPDSGFTDVATDVFYNESVRWMAGNGITVGTSPSTFSPDDVVTRAQMITFIWRLVNSPDAWNGDVVPPDLVMF